MPKIGLRETVFSINCFVAAMLALFISFSIGLERPFWAMLTVYITSQPLSGAARSKAVFRLLGTVVGATAAVVLVPSFVDAPVLLSLALALWIGGCQFVSLLDRTPRSYLFLLAGYTAALIGFPSVAHPEAIFDTAVLRAQEIGIGVSCAALVHSIVWPLSVTEVLGKRLAAIVRETENWVADALAEEPLARTGRERQRLASDVTGLHVLAVHLPFDTARIRPTQAMLSAVQDRLVLLFPLIAALEDRIAALRAEGPLAPEVAEVLGWVRDWVRAPDDAVAAELVARCDALATQAAAPGWNTLLTMNLAARLRELIQLLQATRTLAAQIIRPEESRTAQRLSAERLRLPLHRDYGIALLSALATVLTVLGCCLFWIETSWSDGGTAAMIAAVVCCFFATLDDPVPAQRGFLIWTLVGLPFAALYLFYVLPRIDGFVMLCLVLAPPLLLMGALMGLAQWAGRMMPMSLGFVGGIAITNHLAPDAPAFLNGNIAQLIGVAAAMVMTRLFRVIGAGAAVRRLRLAGWRDLATFAPNASQQAVSAWTSRMLDRVGLIGARIGEAASDQPDVAAATLGELRIGINVAQLPTSPRTDALRRGLADHFARRARRREEVPPPPELLDCIDESIGESWKLDDREEQRRTLSVLTGLRRAVFPAAAPWQPERSAA